MNIKSKVISFKGKRFLMKYYFQPKQSYPFDYNAVCVKINESPDPGYRTMHLTDFSDIEKLKSTLITMLPKDPEDIFDLEVKKWNGNL